MTNCLRLLLTGLFVFCVHPAAYAQRAEFLSDEMKAFVSLDASVIAIHSVRVVDGTGGPAQEGQSILLRDGRIEKIGQNIGVPDDAEIVNGEGLTALPGLVMMHGHMGRIVSIHGVNTFPFDPAYPFIALANGVTTVRTAGSDAVYADLAAKRHIDAGRWIGPDIDVTGSLNAPDPFFVGAIPLDSPEDARAEVRHMAARGVTSFKVYFNMPYEHLRAAIEESHALGLKVAGHLCAVTVSDAAKLGLDSLEHGLWAVTDFVADKEFDVCPEYAARIASIRSVDPKSKQVQDLIRTMIDSGMALTSTLAADHNATCPADRPVSRSVEMLSPRTRAGFETQRSECRSEKWQEMQAPEEIATMKSIMAFQLEFAKAGGLVLAGADLMVGFGDHWQLEMMVEAGHTELDAIKVATHNGALFQERLEEIGTLEKGKRANLFLVSGAPDQNISHIRNVVTVFKDGIGYDSQAILGALKGEVGR